MVNVDRYKQKISVKRARVSDGGEKESKNELIKQERVGYGDIFRLEGNTGEGRVCLPN